MPPKKQTIIDIENLAREWDFEKNIGLDPAVLTKGCTKYAYWMCEKGHKYRARIDHRALDKSGCPFCAGKIPIIGENDLATTNPELMNEWNFQKNEKQPQEYMCSSNKKVHWKCSTCGHEWMALISNRTMMKTGCPECAKNKRMISKTKRWIENSGSLAESGFEFVQEWDFSKNQECLPSEVTLHSNKKVWWVCNKCNESYLSTVNNRANGNGCPYCAGKKPIVGVNDLTTTNPELLEEWDFKKNKISPQECMRYSNRKIWWKCSQCGYEWKTLISLRVAKKTGCPECASGLRTSFPEQCIFYYVSKVCKAINRYVIDGMEIDVFIPDKRIGFEYNGEYYHRNRKEKDIQKQKLLKEKGIRVIRIEEGDAFRIEDDVVYYEYDYKYSKLGDAIDLLMKKALLPKISIDIEKDRAEIRKQYMKKL